MEATHSGGLIGAVSSANRQARAFVNFVSNADRLAIWLVLFAGVITIIKKNFDPEIWTYSMWFGIALGIAALLYEMSSIKRAVTAAWHGRFSAMAWSMIIWGVAFGFSLNQWIGAASENQAEKTNLHKAAYSATVDTRAALKDAEETLGRLKGKYDWSKSLDAPESYDDRIKAAEADAAFEATRNGCKSKCIAKQQLAASLKAERANAIDRAATAEEIKVAEKRVADARKIASSTKTETSDQRKDLVVLTKFAGMSEDTAELFNGLFAIIAISVFLSYASAVKTLDALREQGPRRPFEFFGKAYRWFHRILTGKEAPARSSIHVHTDRASAAAIHAVGQRLGYAT